MAKSSCCRKAQNESGWSKCLERTRSKDALLALSLHIVLLKLHFGLQRAKAKLFDLSGKSWLKAGDPNVPTTEGFFHFMFLSFQRAKRKGRGEL